MLNKYLAISFHTPATPNITYSRPSHNSCADQWFLHKLCTIYCACLFITCATL